MSTVVALFKEHLQLNFFKKLNLFLFINLHYILQLEKIEHISNYQTYKEYIHNKFY